MENNSKVRNDGKINYLVNFKQRERIQESIEKGTEKGVKDFLIFDTETNREKRKNQKIGKKEYNITVNTLNIGYICHLSNVTGEWIEDWYYFEKNEDLHKWVGKKLTETKKRTVWIIAHNLIFDLLITDLTSLFIKRQYQSDFVHSKGMVFLQKWGKYSFGSTSKKKQTDKLVMMVNSGNLFPTPLSKIGKVVGLDKLDMDFDEDQDQQDMEQLKVYCKRDVEILVAFIKKWVDFIKFNNFGKLKFTISSQSMETFRFKFCKHYIVLDPNCDILDFERLAYYGGRTEIFYKGKVRCQLYYYDVNSMYPSVMISERYPTELKFTKENPDIGYVDFMIQEGLLVCAECFIETKNNCYPVRDENNRLIFPTGKFKTYLCTPEVVEGLKNGDIKRFGKVQFYKGAKIFTDYVKHFYDERVKLKKSKNPQEEMFKLFLNSLYGKFGQMTDTWESIEEQEIKVMFPDFDLESWILGEYEFPQIINADGFFSQPKLRYISGQLQISAEKEEANISFPAIAGHVTSYARMIIWDMIKQCKAQGIKMYYGDTDSVFINKELKSDIVHESELGKWKVEKIFPYGVNFINLKNYCELDEKGRMSIEVKKKGQENEKIFIDDLNFISTDITVKGKSWKMKGVSRNSRIIDVNKFVVEIWGSLPLQEYYCKFGRKPGEFWVREQTKINTGKINKGKLTKTGDIKPFKLEEKYNG
jgi:hypothetical protein